MKNSKTLLNYHTKLVNYEHKLGVLNTRLVYNNISYIKTIFPFINTHFSKIVSNNECTLFFDEYNRKINIFKLNPNNISELILDIQVNNIQLSLKNPIPNPNYNLKIRNVLTNHPISWETSKYKVLGNIGDFIIKSEQKFYSKLDSIFQKHYKINQITLKKINTLINKSNKIYLKYQSSLYPIFLDSLNKGIEYTFIEKQPPIKIHFPIHPLSDVLKIKLLKNHEFLVTIPDPSSTSLDAKLEYKIKVEDSKDFIYKELLKPNLISRLKTPIF